MKSNFYPVFGLFLACVLGAFGAHAQTADDGTLHVLRPVIHAEQDKAELCLEFDHTLVAEDQTRAAATVKLESGRKTVPVSARTLGVNGSELCISGLEHRRDYRLTLANLKGAAGEKLASTYSFSFTVPARHPALVFLNNASRSGLMRWQANDPVLRSVNVPDVKYELIRITDPARMAEAWGQRMQTALAPSESATFARANGTTVWQDQMPLDGDPDKAAEQPVPLGMNAGNAPPGLYLLVASAPELREKKSYLIPTAAAWLLRSDIKIHALRAASGFYAAAEKADGSAVLDGVDIKILDRNQQTLAEGKTGGDGLVFLSVPDDKRGNVSVMTGMTAAGDADFFDLTQDTEAYALPANEAQIATGRPFYAPAESVEVTLAAQDIHSHPIAAKGSNLQLLRPDRSLYAAFPLAPDSAGRAHVAFPAPVLSGVWPLVWKAADGGTLAEGTLRVTSNPDAPHLEVSADQALLGDAGAADVTIKSLTGAGAPAPYIAGRIMVDWDVPDHIFPGWDGYHFGTGGEPAPNATPAAFFVTDGKGNARLHLKLTLPDDASPLHAASLKIVSDPAAGALDPSDLTLPVRPKNFIIGIKPAVAAGRFNENSLAHFDIVALDGDGKRRAADDLTYQIYEEGRSFDWYQHEGRWDYKPTQQARRIGGGLLSIPADDARHIEWPVLAGAYQLTVTDASDTVVARMDFSAGWGLAKTETPKPAPLDLKPSSQVPAAGAKIDVHFVLEGPAMITVIIADDQIRTVQHMFKSQGGNDISFTPAADWGNRVSVWVTAQYANSGDEAQGQLVLEKPSAAKIIEAQAVRPQTPASSHAFFRMNENRLTSTPVMSIIEAQTVAPSHAWNPPVEKTHTKAEARVLFLGPNPLHALPILLADALSRHPFTTGELMAQLEILRLWHDVILASGLLTDTVMRAEEDEWVARLVGRQQPDGGFPSLPGGKSDLLGTADALTALSKAREPIAAPAIGPAVDWLHHQLDNTWFDEKERPARAAAYAALAAADKLDPSSLHYFSDTSSDKPLPPLTAAQLAAAFARINDKDKSTYWLGATHIEKNAPEIAPDILPLLAGNPFYDPRNLAAAMQTFADEAVKKPQDLPALASYLDALWHVEDSAGAWRVAINKNERNANGVAIVTWAANAAPPAVRNPGGQPFYVELAQSAQGAPAKDVIVRHIMHLDGSETAGDLKQGETYIVTLEGPWPENGKMPLFVHDDVGPALRPTGCIAEAPSNDFLSWLHAAPLNPIQACEQADGAIDAMIEHPDGAGPTWRIAYLARMETGSSLDLEAPAARALYGNPDLLKGAKGRVRVKG